MNLIYKVRKRANYENKRLDKLEMGRFSAHLEHRRISRQLNPCTIRQNMGKKIFEKLKNFQNKNFTPSFLVFLTFDVLLMISHVVTKVYFFK